VVIRRVAGALLLVAIAPSGCEVVADLGERACVPGARRCAPDGKSIEACSEEGKIQTAEVCGKACHLATCVACTPGNTCGGLKTVSRCTDPNTPPTESSCARDEFCSSGVCNPIEDVATGGDHTCAKAGGALLCWGRNHFGQVGNGSTANTPLPALVDITDVTAMSLGYNHSCALRTDGSVWCWGANDRGQLGLGHLEAKVLAPRRVGGLADVLGIASGAFHTCAMTRGGKVFCWGANGFLSVFGALGVGSSDEAVTVPREVAGLSDVTFITAGGAHTCARIRAPGRWVCWGANHEGQVGDGTILTDRAFFPPVEPKLPADAAEGALLRPGRYHTCAYHSRRVFCWGMSTYGQLGIDPVTDRALPARVLGDFANVYTGQGAYHTCATTAAGVLCWGRNDRGQLGDDSTTNATTPRPVVSLGVVQQLGLGGYHTCARSGREVFCWGHNEHGQLGIGSFEQKQVPTRVVFP